MRNVLKENGSEEGVVVELDPKMTAAQVADEVADLRKLPREGIRLLHNGIELPPTKSLKDCNVQPGDELQVVIGNANSAQTERPTKAGRTDYRGWMFRQGDILLLELKEMPRDALLVGDDDESRVLVRGLETGHEHRLLRGTIFRAPGKDGPRTIVKLGEETYLVHNEHDSIKVPPGIYELRRQRTYIPPDPPARVRAQPSLARRAWKLWED